MRVNYLGNVGIRDDRSVKLDVVGNIRAYTTTSNNGLIISSGSTNTGARNWFVGANTPVAYGDFALQQSNALGGDPRTAGTARLYTLLRVGITTTPSELLHAPGDARIEGRFMTALHQAVLSATSSKLPARRVPWWRSSLGREHQHN
ncbi:hypothetical protein H6783_02240 [Candidatus Nomurabacteria bacterium]|nr:hypothetical protein [Candidatus Nomurabacteria bacterium]